MAEPENRDLAAVFAELADLYEIKGGHRYRARALRRVGKILESLAEPASVGLQFGRLQRRRGVGEGAVIRIREILRTGTCHDLITLRREMSPGIRELLAIDGVGPKTVRTLHTHLRIGSVEELEHAAETGQLAAKLPRFGARAEQRLLRAITDYRERRKRRTPLPEALAIGGRLVSALAELGVVERVDLAGSARRRKELVGDLDLLVASYEPLQVASRLVQLPEVKDVLLRGEKRTSVRLHSGQQVDLRVLVPETYGAGLHYFTGSQRHNIAIRARGNRHGLKISEYGVFTRRGEVRLAGADEADVFAAVGLPLIPAELRENDGEIQAAEAGQLPRLIEPRELLGDLRLSVSPATSPEELAAVVARARGLGLGYLCLSGCFEGLSEQLLGWLEQLERLRQALGEASPVRLLLGVEVAIDAEGQLAVDPTVLEPLDWVIASARDNLDQDRHAMTRRLIRAMETGVVDCLGHPFNRLLDEREPVSLDLQSLINAARRLDVALELCADPTRLDLSAPACRQAREGGALVAIGTGAASPDELEQRLALGIFTARRGWLGGAELLNTRTAEQLSDWRRARLRRLRGGAGGLAAGTADDARAYLEQVAALARQLESPGTLSEALRERLEAWIRGEPDQQLATALGQLDDNPLQRAFALLYRE